MQPISIARATKIQSFGTDTRFSEYSRRASKHKGLDAFTGPRSRAVRTSFMRCPLFKICVFKADGLQSAIRGRLIEISALWEFDPRRRLGYGKQKASPHRPLGNFANSSSTLSCGSSLSLAPRRRHQHTSRQDRSNGSSPECPERSRSLPLSGPTILTPRTILLLDKPNKTARSKWRTPRYAGTYHSQRAPVVPDSVRSKGSR